MRHISNEEAGFTLIELLVTVVIVAVGLIGVTSFFNAGLLGQSEAKNELIAAGLAQEGAELARNLADWKKLNGSDWTGIVNTLKACGDRIDYRSLTGAHPCQNGSSTDICSAGGQYYQCASGETGIGMTRTISFTYSASEKSLTITSEVKWNNNSRTTTAKDSLYENDY